MAMGKEKKEKDETGAEGVLNTLLPGLGELVSTLKERSPALKQRLEETDKEIERRIATGGSKKPIIDYGMRVRSLVPEGGDGHATFNSSFRPLVKKAQALPKPTQKAKADVFDEKDAIIIIAELPNVKKEDITVKADDGNVEISAMEYYEKIRLPTEVAGKPTMKFKNGILELRFAKKGRKA